MADKALRKRKDGATKGAIDKADPLSSPVTTTRQLERALVEVRKQVLQRGLSVDDFNACLATAVDTREKSTRARSRTSRKANVPQWTKYSSTSASFAFVWCQRCLKLSWLLFVLCVALILLAAYCKPVGFFLSRTMQTHVYAVVRQVRLGLITFLPLLNLVGLDIWQGCVAENPFVNFTERCPCLHRTGALVAALEEGMLPARLLHNPRDVVVVRKASESKTRFTLKMFQDFYQTHGSGGIAEIHSQYSFGSGGPSRYEHVFNVNTMEKLLAEGKQWSFVW